MNNCDCSLLVMSCDKNISLLNILLDFLDENWMDCPFQRYIGLEKIGLVFSNSITLSSDKKGWGERLKGYLDEIHTNYVMIILDDFLPEKKVDTNTVLQYLSYMKDNRNIATISLADIYDNHNIIDEKTGLCRRLANANYLLNLQVGIWDKELLKSLLKDNENPWQTELFGSIRARQFRNREFLCLKSDADSPYIYNRGWLMVRGAWNGNEIQRLGLERYSKELFDGKDILYSNLMHIGIMARIYRRLQIEYRKFMSLFGIFI